MSPEQIVALMNAQDAIAVAAVASVAAEVATAAALIAGKLAAGGRLIYAGAGTSGRLGVLDASECPPTFRSDPAKVVGLIAAAGRFGDVPSSRTRRRQPRRRHVCDAQRRRE